MSTTTTRVTFWIMVWSLGLILLFGALPLLSTLALGVVAEALGCTVNEGGVYPCPWHGYDLGETLSVLFTPGWFAFATIPMALIGLAVWSVVAVVLLLLRMRNRNKAQI